jgi:transposase-like protein
MPRLNKTSSHKIKIQMGNAVIEPAMSFNEIGERLGISYQAAQQAYHSGISKLRGSKALEDLFVESERETSQRTVGWRQAAWHH